VSFPAGDLRIAFNVARDVGDARRRWTRSGEATAEQTRVHVML